MFRRSSVRRALTILAGAGLAAGLAACGLPTEGSYPEALGRGQYDPTGSNKTAQRDSVFGPGGLSFGGGPKRRDDAEAGVGIGVNSFLWRASLDTVGFMPLASADPFGGVIITDWYSPPGAPDERFKVTVYILDRRLRADGIKTAVFKQTRGPGGEWVDAPTTPETVANLENSILTRARQLRIDAASR